MINPSVRWPRRRKQVAPSQVVRVLVETGVEIRYSDGETRPVRVWVDVTRAVNEALCVAKR